MRFGLEHVSCLYFLAMMEHYGYVCGFESPLFDVVHLNGFFWLWHLSLPLFLNRLKGLFAYWPNSGMLVEVYLIFSSSLAFSFCSDMEWARAV